MIVGKAIYHLLTNATAITDIVGTRIYPEVAQQDGDLPYIVYNITNNEPSDTKPEPSKLDTAGVEVNCYATSYSQAIDIAVAVRGALDRVKGTYNGVNVQSIQYVNEIIDFDEPQRAYNISADYEVRISRTDFEIAQGSPITGVELGKLSDVNVTGVTDNQILSYDAATDTWVPAADAGGAENIDNLDDVNAGSPNNNDVLKFNSSTSKWTPVDWLSVLYAQLKQGSDATITNGSLTDSSLELTSTQAKLKAGITGLDITETSPGTIEIIVATDATGSTEFTALTLEGLTTSEKARFTVNNGTSFYIHGTSAYNNQLRGNSGITSSKVNMLPASDGLLALDADIPSTTDDLTEGSTNIYYTEARVSANTDVAANTAKVGVIAGGTTGQALVKTSGADYDVEWADIAVDVQYHQRYDTEAAALRSGATETVELYYTAQADGDGLSESASSDTPTSGYDIRRKLWYAEKAQADPDTSADWTQFTAIADNTTYANAKAALLAYLKERTGGTVPISLKMTWEEVAQAPAFTGLLNESYGSGAAAAYSVRRLNGNYTGAAIEVERSSDNTTQDIGFDANGDLDESALTTFCTGTTCKVRTWYDQSQTGGTGSGNDLTQTLASAQPIIYESGAIVKLEGRVAMKDENTATVKSLTASISNSLLHTSNEFASTAVYKGDSNAQLYLGVFDIATFPEWAPRRFSYDSAYTPTLRTGGTSLVDIRTVGFLNRSGNTVTSFQNQNANINTTDTASISSATLSAYGIGRMRYGAIVQEYISWNTDKSSVRTSIESNIGDYFTQNTPLLDTYSGAAAAYSLRLLDSTYTGSAVEVYNGSSYADIGFNVFGELDTVALAAHCGSNNGFVSKWYDQSGNSNDATQTTTANMPKIYDGTTGVVTENGKPAVYSSGGHNLNTGLFAIGTSGDITLDFFGVMNNQSVSDGCLFQLGDNLKDTDRRHVLCYRNDSATQKSVRLYGGNVVVDSSVSGQTLFNTNYQGGGGAFEIRFDGSTATPSSASNSGLNIQSNSGFGLFGQNAGLTPEITANSSDAIGYLQEVVFYLSNQSSNRTNIEDNINTFYSIY